MDMETLGYRLRRDGLLGLLRKARTRILGPSKKELLDRIDALSRENTAQYERLIARLDATVHYVAERMAEENEKRIAAALQRPRHEIEARPPAISAADADRRPDPDGR